MSGAGLRGRVLARHVASAALVAQALSTVAFAEPDSPGNQRELSGAEIRAAFVGKIITDGIHWSAYLLPDGSFKSVEMGRSRRGHWKVSGKELCLSTPAGSAFDRWTVVRSGKGFVLRANGQDLYEVDAEPPSAKYHFD